MKAPEGYSPIFKTLEEAQIYIKTLDQSKNHKIILIDIMQTTLTIFKIKE